MTKMQGNASRVQVPGPSLAEAIESSALRLTQAGIVSGQTQGAGHGQLATAAQGKTLNAGDDRLA